MPVTKYKLDAAIKWFLQDCERRRKLSPHTLNAYRYDLQDFAGFMGNKAVQKTDRGTVKHWLAETSAKKGVTAATTRRKLAVVKSMFSCLESNGKITVNVMAGWRPEPLQCFRPAKLLDSYS